MFPASAIVTVGPTLERGNMKYPCAVCDIKSGLFLSSQLLYRDIQRSACNLLRDSLCICSCCSMHVRNLVSYFKRPWQDPSSLLLNQLGHIKIYSLYLALFQDIRCISCCIQLYLQTLTESFELLSISQDTRSMSYHALSHSHRHGGCEIGSGEFCVSLLFCESASR